MVLRLRVDCCLCCRLLVLVLIVLLSCLCVLFVWVGSVVSLGLLKFGVIVSSGCLFK